jgi:hypothetical protein
MGMSMHDKYYEPEDDDMGDFIDIRTAELLNTKDYDPSDISHLAEAISEASAEDQQTIKDFIDNAEWEKLGMKLYYISHEYMEKFAESHAVDEYNSGLLND